MAGRDERHSNLCRPAVTVITPVVMLGSAPAADRAYACASKGSIAPFAAW